MIRKSDFQQLQSIFHPRSVAVVGASADPERPGGAFFQNLVTSGFKGRLYPVNLKGGRIGEYRLYRRLTDIRGPVDLVIVSVPRDGVVDVLEDCAAKKVKGVHFFTAGFGELGDSQGKRLDGEMLRLARRGGFRIVGPNSAGLACPSCRMPIGPEGFLGEAGDIAFVSQSGSLSLEVVQQGMARGLGFSQVVSMGNGLDLEATDYLRYFAEDPQTAMVGLYLEGVKDRRLFLRLVEAVSETKPVLLMKGGRTGPGRRAAHSHTAAPAGPEADWKGAAEQAGALWVEGLYEMVDALVALKHFRAHPSPLRGEGKGEGDGSGIRSTAYLRRKRLEGIGVVSGLADGGGGTAIMAADMLAAAGLSVPELSVKTRVRLKDTLGAVGSILVNPVDVSQVQGRFQAVEDALAAVAADRAVDLVLVYENLYTLARWHSFDRIRRMNRMFARVCRERKKPLAIVLPPEMCEAKCLELAPELAAEGVMVFPSAERAASALALLKRRLDR